MTGAVVPDGVDVVEHVEQTDGGLEIVQIAQVPEPGAHIRRAGEDARAGDIVLTAGILLGPPGGCGRRCRLLHAARAPSAPSRGVVHT
jgi:molybdopterin molybdotransferase